MVAEKAGAYTVRWCSGQESGICVAVSRGQKFYTPIWPMGRCGPLYQIWSYQEWIKAFGKPIGVWW